jgi:hypothetical protein
MIPRIVLFSSILALALTLASCSPQKEGGAEKVGAQKLAAAGQIELAKGEFSLVTRNGKTLEIAPKVPIERSEKLIQVLNLNLDLDLNEEQILVLGAKDDPEAPLRIAVVDYDAVRGAYLRGWEGITASTNPRLFEVSQKDLVGDHNQEIVCRGINGRGEQVLDVFRKTPAPSGVGLYFTEICQIVSEGSIEIQEIERSEGYRLGQKNGPSFAIYAYSRDKTSPNLLDRIRTTYQWQYQQNRYVLSGEEKLPGAVVEERQLRELFADPSVEAFESFLAGPWYLAGSEGREEIILFSPEGSPKDRRITIYSGQVEEIYVWQTSYRTLPNRLYIESTNESIESIRERIYVDVVSLNTIEVTLVGSEEWNRTSGRYLKLTEELQEQLLKQKQTEVKPASILLKGIYRDEQGTEIIFDPPHFSWIGDKRQFSGGFAVISLDKTVLYLKGLDENGLPVQEATYIIEFTEKKEGQTAHRTLSLQAGRMGVHGVEALSEQKRVFVQREDLEKKPQ